MNSKTKMLCAFTVFLFLGSLTFGSVSAYNGTVNNEQLIPAETYGDDRRNEAVNIIIPLQYVDIDQEWSNMMDSLISSLEGKFTYDNLTDYTQLASVIDEYDVLLIPEMEDLNFSTSNTIAAAWSSFLPSFVENGGIVICMGFEYLTVDHGSTHNILNATGLMELYNPEPAYIHQMNVVDSNDALARTLPATYSSSSGSLSYDTTDGTIVVEDNTDGKAVVVHKTIGKGHVVMLGFDMFTAEGNQDLLLRNAILLHRHVVFDNSHSQYDDINAEFSTLADDLPFYGFSVSSMETFDPAIIDSCEILVVSYCITDYNQTEINLIDDFVNSGGGLYIITDWGVFGNGTDDLMDNFGFARNTTVTLVDSDDYNSNTNWPIFYPENLNMHSTKVGVDVVEFYGAPTLTEIPESAVHLITTDIDGTATMGSIEANGEPMAAADLVGEGRIVVITDNALVTDDDYDSDAIINYRDADNEIFCRNIFRWLAGAGIPEQTVLFDQSHGPWGYVSSSLNELANFMMFNGYNVEFMSTFNPTAFTDADILVIFDGSTSYNTTEIALIEDFVANGGGLLLWGNYGSLITELDPIGQEFNLHVNTTGFLRDSDDYEAFPNYIIYDGSNIGEHPIMDGVERIEIYGGGAFDSIGTGTELFKTDNDGTSTWNDDSPAGDLAVFAATTYEMGRVVFFTDIDLGRTIDGDSDGFGCLYDSDNPVFVANVLKWLAENRRPTVEVITPNGGEVLNGTITIEWDAVDFDNDPMTFDVLYSDNNGADWTILADDTALIEFAWNTTQHDDGTEYLIRVIVTAGDDVVQDYSDGVFELDNFAGTTPGMPLDPTLLLIIGAAVLVVVIILVIVMKKKK